MDTLSLLRDFNVRSELDAVKVDGDLVHFGDKYSFPKSSLTAYKSDALQAFYPLEAVLFYLKNKELGVAKYLPAARAAGVQAVSLPDQQVRGTARERLPVRATSRAMGRVLRRPSCARCCCAAPARVPRGQAGCCSNPTNPAGTAVAAAG